MLGPGKFATQPILSRRIACDLQPLIHAPLIRLVFGIQRLGAEIKIPVSYTHLDVYKRQILLCAIGIAVRTLGPVLRDKYQDPAVVALDEHGRFVVPILSGHEGGANEWARQISEWLGAQCVITGAQLYTLPLLTAGMGCNRGCPLDSLLALLDETLEQHGLRRDQLQALASIELKKDEPGLQQLAATLHLPISFYSAVALNEYSDCLLYTSRCV